MNTHMQKRVLVSTVALAIAAFLAGAPQARAGDYGWSGSSYMHEGSGSQRAMEKVNLNTASEEELARVPGISYDMAKAIVDYRDASGPFYWVDQLLKVKGIGPEELNSFRDRVTVW